MKDRFPYEECQWADPKHQADWFDALERSGTEVVRMRLAQHEPGSGSTMAIGKAHWMTKGFAEEWLAWHDRRKAEREAQFRKDQIFWSRWGALAATVTALVALAGAIITRRSGLW